MTEEMIKKITDAEEQGALLKEKATEKATLLLSEAERQVARTLQSSAEVCRAYSETQLKNARAEADIRYAETLETERKKARAYCAEMMKSADGYVSGIVGRIVGGDC